MRTALCNASPQAQPMKGFRRCSPRRGQAPPKKDTFFTDATPSLTANATGIVCSANDAAVKTTIAWKGDNGVPAGNGIVLVPAAVSSSILSLACPDESSAKKRRVHSNEPFVEGRRPPDHPFAFTQDCVLIVKADARHRLQHHKFSELLVSFIQRKTSM